MSAPETWSPESLDLRNQFWNVVQNFNLEMDDYFLHRALASLWKYINSTNAYFHKLEPWKIAKTDPAKFNEVISATCHSLYGISILLWSVMPYKMEELLSGLGIKVV